MLDRIGFEQSTHTRNRQHPESSLWRPSRTVALVMWVSGVWTKNLFRQSRHLWCIAIGDMPYQEHGHVHSHSQSRSNRVVRCLDPGWQGSTPDYAEFCQRSRSQCLGHSSHADDQITGAGASIRKLEIPMITQALRTAQHPALGWSFSIWMLDWSPPPRTTKRLPRSRDAVALAKRIGDSAEGQAGRP